MHFAPPRPCLSTSKLPPTMLLDTHALLVNINEVEWLVSNRSVAELEDKLPHSERVEWARQMESMPGATKFEKLKNFLVGRKKILENLETMGCRPASAASQDKCDAPARSLP